MDGQIRKKRTLEAIKRIVLRESLNQPLMVIFEDLHWLDAESQGLLNLLADSIANAPVLMLVNYRPEYTHSWGSKTCYTQLRLDPLGKENAEEMLDALFTSPAPAGLPAGANRERSLADIHVGERVRVQGSGPPVPGQGEGRGGYKPATSVTELTGNMGNRLNGMARRIANAVEGDL
jgi:hypothetical protein